MGKLLKRGTPGVFVSYRKRKFLFNKQEHYRYRSQLILTPKPF